MPTSQQPGHRSMLVSRWIRTARTTDKSSPMHPFIKGHNEGGAGVGVGGGWPEALQGSGTQKYELKPLPKLVRGKARPLKKVEKLVVDILNACKSWYTSSKSTCSKRSCTAINFAGISACAGGRHFLSASTPPPPHHPLPPRRSQRYDRLDFC